MSTLLHDASLPVFGRYLARLQRLLELAESFADAHALAHPVLLDARLAPDMAPFATQVVITANFALRASFPLTGQAVPPFPACPPSFAGLHAHVSQVQAQLAMLLPADFDGAEARLLESQAGEAKITLPAPEFLFQYAIPNFFFHLSVAYALLRQQGVPLGKQDFDGFHAYPRPT